jgi:hypothetical protein
MAAKLLSNRLFLMVTHAGAAEPAAGPHRPPLPAIMAA